MITISLADNLAKIGDPIEGDGSIVSGIGYDIAGFIVFGIILGIAALIARSATRKSNEARFGPPVARNTNRAAADTADFATFAPDHGPITIHSTHLGQKRTVTIPLADGRSRARKRSALDTLTDNGRTPIGPVLRTSTPPIYAVPVAHATTTTRAAGRD